MRFNWSFLITSFTATKWTRKRCQGSQLMLMNGLYRAGLIHSQPNRLPWNSHTTCQCVNSVAFLFRKQQCQPAAKSRVGRGGLGPTYMGFMPIPNQKASWMNGLLNIGQWIAHYLNYLATDAVPVPLGVGNITSAVVCLIKLMCIQIASSCNVLF